MSLSISPLPSSSNILPPSSFLLLVMSLPSPHEANPMSFSSVQLSNFLKSSKMNRSIVKMNEGDGANTQGRIMASDRSKTIFVKDVAQEESKKNGYAHNYNGRNSSGSRNSSSGREEEEGEKGGFRRRHFPARKKSSGNASSGSSSEEEEEEGEQREVRRGHFPVRKKGRGNASSGSSSENDDDKGSKEAKEHNEKLGGSLEAAKKRGSAIRSYPTGDRETKKVQILTSNHKSHARFYEGSNSDATLSMSEQLKNDEKLALILQREEEEDANEVKKVTAEMDEELALHLQRREEEDTYNDTATSAAMDEELAIQLQRKEMEGAECVVRKSEEIIDLTGPGNMMASLRESESWSNSVGGMGEATCDSSNGDEADKHDPAAADDDDDDDEGIDWEDGDAILVDRGAGEDEGGEDNDIDDDDDSNIEWEDGAIMSHGNISDELEGGNHSCQSTVEDRAGGAEKEGNRRQARHESEVTEAQVEAFSEAASDAARLTSWAGRAVARAIKEHMGTTTSSSMTRRPLQSHDESSSDESETTTPAHLGPDADTNGGTSDGNDAVDNVPHVPATNSKEVSRKPEVEIQNSLLTKRRPPSHQQKPASHSFQRTADELDDTNRQVEYAREALKIKQQMKRQERDETGITDEMRDDVMRMLQLFGLPYVIAPAEAESQCVQLEKLGLVDGIVTEDSDAFVFGGKKIYRNIFDERKFVEVYLASDAEKEMGLSAQHFVFLAMILGGDYTPGVRGVGIVNGIEILNAFPVQEGDLFKALKDFKEWLEGFDPMDIVEGDTVVSEGMTEREIFHQKHKKMRNRWVAPPSFPGRDVLQAYQKPIVDGSTEKFSWGRPDLSALNVMCAEKFGWSMEESSRQLDPVIAKMNEGSRQTRIDGFFTTYKDKQLGGVIKSKRLGEALKRKLGVIPGAEIAAGGASDKKARGSKKKKEDYKEQKKKKKKKDSKKKKNNSKEAEVDKAYSGSDGQSDGADLGGSPIEKIDDYDNF